jgi:hypothetical protein
MQTFKRHLSTALTRLQVNASSWYDFAMKVSRFLLPGLFAMTILFVVAGRPLLANAEIVQPDSGTQSAQGYATYVFNVGNGYSGMITNAWVAFAATTTTANAPDIDIFTCSDAMCTTNYGVCEMNGSGQGFGTLNPSSYYKNYVVTQQEGTGCDVTSGEYIWVEFDVGPEEFFGTTGNTLGWTSAGTTGDMSPVSIPYISTTGLSGGGDASPPPSLGFACNTNAQGWYDPMPANYSTTTSLVTISNVLCVPSVNFTFPYGVEYGIELWKFPIKPLQSPIFQIQGSVTANETDISTTTTLADGDYQVQYTALGSIFGFPDLLSLYGHQEITRFTVGTTSVYGNVNIADIFGIASSTRAKFATDCDVFAGGDFVDCVGDLFVPDPSDLSYIFSSNILPLLTYPPFGYATQIWNDFEYGMGTTTIGSLPEWVITLPNGYPGASTSVDLTPWRDLLGASSTLSLATDPNSGKTLYEIVYPGWSDFVYFLFAIVIFGELIGLGGKWVTSQSL